MSDPAPEVALPVGRGRAERLAWGLVAAAGAAVLWCLVRFWGSSVEYSDRWLIVLGSAWLVWRGRSSFAQRPARPSWLGLLPLTAGAVLFPLAWFLAAQVAPKPLLLWWLTTAWVLLAAGLVLTLYGFRRLWAVAFPLVFLFFALPIPNRIRIPLQEVLQEATTSLAAATLPALGFPTERSGFVLRLSGGDLGVAEACSGVRSLTALTAIAAFVAHLRGFGLVRGLLLLVFSLPVVVVCNAVRVVITGVLQEKVGVWAIQGWYHEAVGIVMVLFGLGLILMIARGLSLVPGPWSLVKNQGPGTRDRGPGTNCRLRWSALAVVLIGALGTAVAHFCAGAAIEEEAEAAPIAELPLRLDDWQGEDLPIDPTITEMLTYDRAIRRRYRNKLGQELQVWVIYWSASTAIKGFHHPDICMPNHGWTAVKREIVPMKLAAGRVLPVTVRHFERDGQQQQLYYWTQEGPRVWTDLDEAQAVAAGPNHLWVFDRFRQGERLKQVGRLSVLIGADLWGGDYAERSVGQFCRRFADEIYRLCPWALPQSK